MDQLSQAKEREIHTISARHGRHKHGKTIVEGVRAIETMLQCGVQPEYIAVCRQVLTAEGEKFMVELSKHEFPTYDFPARNFAKLAETVHSQGFLAVVKTTTSPLTENEIKQAKFMIYLDGISDPGNLGTIIRTAAAFAVDLIVASSTTVDPFNPKVIRASAGLIFKTPLHRLEDFPQFVDILASNRIQLLGSAPEAPTELEKLTLGKKVCLAVGSEATGLSPATRHACKSQFRIKTAGGVESLNAAAAAAIAIHHIAMKLEML